MFYALEIKTFTKNSSSEPKKVPMYYLKMLYIKVGNFNITALKPYAIFKTEMPIKFLQNLWSAFKEALYFKC